MEFPRWRSLGTESVCEVGDQETKANGAGNKVSACQKPCEKMTEAIVMDGGKRGQVVKVCADPACRIHHPIGWIISGRPRGQVRAM